MPPKGKKKSQRKEHRKRRRIEKEKKRRMHVKINFNISEIFESEADLDKQYHELKTKVVRALQEKMPGMEILKQSGKGNLEKKIAETFARFQHSGAEEDATFYLFDLTTAIIKYKEWVNLLPRVTPFYAMKCNPDQAMVNTLVACGAGLDCASMAEMQQGLASGVSPDKMIFANPCKMLAHIRFAKEKGIRMMTFDNKQELLKVHSIFPRAQMVLRILGDDSHSTMRFGSKFGARVDSEVKELLELAYSLNLEVVGVSFHVGSGCMAVEGFINSFRLARKVFDMAEQMGHKMTLLDIGGGFPGHDTDSLKFDRLAEEIAVALNQLFPEPDLRIIAEPGRYFATECVVLVTSVVAKRERFVQTLRPIDHHLYDHDHDHDEDSYEGHHEDGQPDHDGCHHDDYHDDDDDYTSDSAHDLSVEPSPETSPSASPSSSPRQTRRHASEPEMELVTEKIVHYYISDGVYGSFNNLMFDHAQAHPVGMQRPGSVAVEAGQPERSVLFGPTCDSIDVICSDVLMPPMEIGDLVYFFNMGAYTSAAASSFNGFAPPQPTYLLC